MHVGTGWQGSDRTHHLPPDWKQRKAAVWRRDGDVCWRCRRRGADAIDHKVRGDDHSLTNLAPIHQDVPPFCHRSKSSAEGNAARWQVREQRPVERHPGMI